MQLRKENLKKYHRGQGQASIFFTLSFRNCISCVHNCNDLPSNKFFTPQFTLYDFHSKFRHHPFTGL